MARDVIGVGVVGAGRWGSNYVRILAALPEVDLRWVCDIDPRARARVICTAPDVPTFAEMSAALTDPGLQAVVVATSAGRHPACARAALDAGKHVLLEKPMAPTVAEARALAALAQRARRTLLVGHVMLYHPAVETLRALVAEGALGPVQRLFARRTNVDRLVTDQGALWSLAPHDLSIVDLLLGREPIVVAARRPLQGTSPGEDAAVIELAFSGGVAARVHVADGAARRVRRLVVVGARGIAVFDEDAAGARVRVHARDGSVAARELPLPASAPEPLRAECEHFVRCVAGAAEPRSSAEQGVRVVRWIAAAERSLLFGGRPVQVAGDLPALGEEAGGPARAAAG